MNTSSESTDQSSADGVSDHSPLAADDLAADDLETLDPHETALEAAALAAHLHRAGVEWLPLPNLQATTQLASRFAAADEIAKPTVQTQGSHAAIGAKVPPASGGNVQQGGSPAGMPTPQSRPSSSGVKPNRPPSTRPATRLQGVPAIEATPGEYPGRSLNTDQRILQLKQLEEVFSSSSQGKSLTSSRNGKVFGEGNPNPRFAFFGEELVKEKDVTGQPLVDPAGQLLTRMLQACTFARDEVYILNTIKYPALENRNPESSEIESSQTFYQQHFEILRPEYIVCFGAVSSQELLNTKLSVGRLRGTLHRYFASKVLVTYPPDYLYRNPAAKKAAWADLQLLMRDAGITPPKR